MSRAARTTIHPLWPGLAGFGAWLAFFFSGYLPGGWPSSVPPWARVAAFGILSAAFYAWMVRAARPRLPWVLAGAAGCLLAAATFLAVVFVATFLLAAF